MITALLLAATVYIRDGASGSGADWNNALDDLPASLVRGNTYLLTDGTYASRVFNDAPSGVTEIIIKKATIADHGTETGWLNSYGDGTASFGSNIRFYTDYYVFDGSTRDENNWTNFVYGFKVESVSLNKSVFGFAGNHIKIIRTEIGPTYSRDFTPGLSRGVDIVSFTTPVTDIVISNCFIHNNMLQVMITGGDGIRVEKTWMGPGWDKEAIRGQTVCKNSAFKHNVFDHASQLDPTEPGSGCTADIAIWDGSDSGAFDNILIEGNVIYSYVHHSGGAFVVGGNGGSWPGVGTTGTKIYNNSIIGISAGTAVILVHGSGNEIFNNGHFDIPVGIGTSSSASLTGNNVVATVNPFVGLHTWDWRILESSQFRNVGSNRGLDYSVDRYSTTRGGDGTWDVGAYEYSAGAGTATLNKINTSGRVTLSGRVTF